MRFARGTSGVSPLVLGVLLALSCASGSAATPRARRASPASESPAEGAALGNPSRCDDTDRADREAVEATGAGSTKPSIRRVYRVFGQGEDRRRFISCRQVDTNLDGVKDVVREYDDQGEVVEERADANYDGVVDTWIRFEHGKLVQVDVDEAWDGQPDESRYYVRGKLTRIVRDTNQDGKPDVWEVYAHGRLDRMGVDLDHDGRVDRWSRDTTRAGTRYSDEEPGPAKAPNTALDEGE